MKILIFCLVLGTALKFNTAEDIPSGCPPEEDPRYPTHLPHATDCNKFWKCLYGEPYLQNCEGGLEWSIVNSWCDYPNNAKCVRPLPEDGGETGGEESGEDGGDSSAGEIDLPTGCPANEDPRYPTHLPHATDCDKFWKCWDGVPYLNECPQGQHWSIENTWCDYPENAKCIRPIPEDGGENGGGVESSEESGENGGEIIPTECTEDPTGPAHIPHATECTKFWQCVGGKAYLSECPSGLHWNIDLQYCDYRENANCVRPLQQTIRETILLSDDVAEGYSCPAKEDIDNPVHLPHASDRTKFWKCFNGSPILQECPGDLEWNIQQNYCDYAWSDNENENDEEEAGETFSPSGCPAIEDPRYPTHLPHATDCDKFWKCMDGAPYLHECPQGQHWSIENTWCDYPENAKCVRPIPDDGEGNGGGENGEDDSSEEGGETDLPTGCPAVEDPRYPTHLPHATDCDKFWKCWDGVPYLNECPQGQHWNIENTWCDYIENAKCIRPIPEDGGENGGGAESSEESGENGGEIIPTECTEDPTGPAHIPHATDCTKFWQCVSGKAYLSECPSGLHWNIDLQYCDYRENANCVRPLQQTIRETVALSYDVADGYNCPAIEDVENPVHLPHASDCSKFWKCFNGSPILQGCPGGLEWNIQGNYCDYASEANCSV